MVRIALGSTSEVKQQVLQHTLQRLAIAAEVRPVSVSSGVSPQPQKSGETRRGATNRADAALHALPESAIGLGLEFGYEPIEGQLYMHAWSAIVDASGATFAEQSSTLELPKYFAAALARGEEVGTLVDDYELRSSDPTWRYFGEMIRHRTQYLHEAVRNVLLRYRFRDEY